MKSNYLFDSHALLAYFQNEEGADVVFEVLNEVKNAAITPMICVINLGEIIYLTKRRFGDRKKVEVLGRIHEMGFDILPASDEIVYKAAELKAEYPISYADCFAVACAIDKSSTILTGDPDFKKVTDLVEVKWIR
ncbi:MAG: type II toxin-antitoxin system VapC family toxin [Proteobacteria bacterium]|nr:type II toxin-antitoxin system VapC family toxin [Pseudomonadota bacterium]